MDEIIRRKKNGKILKTKQKKKPADIVNDLYDISLK